MQQPKASLSRREFLTYAWMGGLGLLTLEGAAVALWYSIPPHASSLYTLKVWPLSANSSPIEFTAYRLWLTYSTNGLNALAINCPRLAIGHIYKWVDANGRFECPVCGGKFDLDGNFIEGFRPPKPLGRYVMTIQTTHGKLKDVGGDGPVQVDITTVERILIDPTQFVGSPINPY